ncbi:unknown [Prevotella sp. CAG:5226]|nr:unknown [Prevotella sp. CAG:5226]
MQTCYSNCSHARVRRFISFYLHSVQIVRTMLIISVFGAVGVDVLLVCTGVFVSTRGLGTWSGECAMMGQRGKNNIFAHKLNQKMPS